jgi:hypothetical protein
MKNKIITVVVVAGLMAVTSAKATTIVFDNITGIPTSGHDSVSGIGPIYGSFTSAGTAQTLTSLELRLWAATSPGAGTLSIGLYSDSSTSPGVLIATLGTMSDSSFLSGYNNYNFSLSQSLAASTRYWIGLTDSGQSAYWAWTADVSGPGVANEYIDHLNVAGSPQVWINPPNGGYMMQVVENVPDNGRVPDAGSTAALLGLAVASLVGLRRKLA